MKTLLTLALLVLLASTLRADLSDIATLRQSELAVQPEPPRLSQTENKDLKRVRSYPMQPPTIPHKIDKYEVNLNANRCLTCHARNVVSASQAPMVSVTHFMDRYGNFLAEVSPRRYFCNQCHVTQSDAQLLIGNEFKDVATIIRQAQ
ncbi:MAG: nitrate reductase cytochrome c-type subunit [Granulosicoccus sp.]